MNRTYKNPIARNGDFADPFVLRYNGKYYLYCTNPDIRCFSSYNLVDWKPEGASIEEDTFPDMVPFAPEVVYSNGKFYMYTSPSGFGHYVLESDKPTGPFHKITDNIGHAIDGSVFIDDDGRWYFYWAGEGAIWGCEMYSPIKFGEPIRTGVTLHGWTEGPFICKRDGIYYMTYTGNHYLSKGYRINTASSRHPLKSYKDDSMNPAVIHTQNDVVGLGHSSTIIGPDLVSYYMVYHNMNEDASRDLDIDRQLWYGNVTQILGPTRNAQPVPALPDYAYPDQTDYKVKTLEWDIYIGSYEQVGDMRYSKSNHFMILTNTLFARDFTAEFHVVLPAAAGENKRGLWLKDTSGASYSFVLDRSSHSFQVWDEQNNKIIASEKLPSDYKFETLHTIRLERNGELIECYIDNRHQLRVTDMQIGKFRLGYFAEGGRIGFGYTALTESTYLKEINQTLIPAGCSFYPVFGNGDIIKGQDGSIFLKKGEEVQYKLQIDKEGDYTFFINHNIAEKGNVIEGYVDENQMEFIAGDNHLMRYRIRLAAGEQMWKLRVSEGFIKIKSLKMIMNKEDDILLYELKENPITDFGNYGKKLYGQETWCDYSVEAMIAPHYLDEKSRAGILMRVTEPSEGGEGADTVLGIHFFIGYSVSLTGNQLIIARHQYDESILAACPCETISGQSYKLRVIAAASQISVWINDEKTPRLSVCDKEPITNGCTGVWVNHARISVKQLVIKQNTLEKRDE